MGPDRKERSRIMLERGSDRAEARGRPSAAVTGRGPVSAAAQTKRSASVAGVVTAPAAARARMRPATAAAAAGGSSTAGAVIERGAAASAIAGEPKGRSGSLNDAADSPILSEAITDRAELLPSLAPGKSGLTASPAPVSGSDSAADLVASWAVSSTVKSPLSPNLTIPTLTQTSGNVPSGSNRRWSDAGVLKSAGPRTSFVSRIPSPGRVEVEKLTPVAPKSPSVLDAKRFGFLRARGRGRKVSGGDTLGGFALDGVYQESLSKAAGK